MNYCTRAYSKQSICYLSERSQQQQQQNSSQKKESESVQNKESTVRKIQENTRLDTVEEDKLSGWFSPRGLAAWELAGPAHPGGYEPIKHPLETGLTFSCQKGVANAVPWWLDGWHLSGRAIPTSCVSRRGAGRLCRCGCSPPAPPRLQATSWHRSSPCSHERGGRGAQGHGSDARAGTSPPLATHWPRALPPAQGAAWVCQVCNSSLFFPNNALWPVLHRGQRQDD